MRAGIRGLGAALLSGGLLMPAGPARGAEAVIPQAAGPRAAASAAPVPLVVGLRSGADARASIAGLGAHADAGDTPLVADGSAVTVRVPADHVAEAMTRLRNDPAVSYVEVDRVARMTGAPNDPAYSGQWGLDVAGVAEGWRLTHGARRVTIAVVDTGVKPIPDLAGRLLPGYDFVNHDSDPNDDEGHGTMTAGVLGASANNDIGVAGICWYCRILPVKVLDSDGFGLYSDIASGIRYAANRGADVINLSLGGSDDSRVLREAVDYATRKGSLVIAAAGNEGSKKPEYPAAIPNALAVGASTEDDARYSWSNYGAGWVDIAAPGCNLAQDRAGDVEEFCGTSSSTPFVAGVAGLLAATTPMPSAAQIRSALMSSATPLSGGWVAAASGRVDASAALQALPFWFAGATKDSALGRSFTLQPHVGTHSGIDSVYVQLNGATVARAHGAPWTVRVDAGSIRGGATLTVIARSGRILRSRTDLNVTVS